MTEIKINRNLLLSLIHKLGGEPTIGTLKEEYVRAVDPTYRRPNPFEDEPSSLDLRAYNEALKLELGRLFKKDILQSWESNRVGIQYWDKGNVGLWSVRALMDHRETEPIPTEALVPARFVALYANNQMMGHVHTTQGGIHPVLTPRSECVLLDFTVVKDCTRDLDIPATGYLRVNLLDKVDEDAVLVEARKGHYGNWAFAVRTLNLFVEGKS